MAVVRRSVFVFASDDTCIGFELWETVGGEIVVVSYGGDCFLTDREFEDFVRCWVSKFRYETHLEEYDVRVGLGKKTRVTAENLEVFVCSALGL